METTTQQVEWFNRYGAKVTGRSIYAVNLSKGTAQHAYISKCSRCGGAGGSDKWKMTGWTCFECNGSGRGPERVERLYTAERLAKLQAAQAKRDATRLAKLQAAQAIKDAERAATLQAFQESHPALVKALEANAVVFGEGQGGDSFLVDLWNKMLDFGSLTDGQIEAAQKTIDREAARAAQRAASQFVGEVGKRLVFTLTVEHIIKLEADDPFSRGGRYNQWALPSIYLCRDDKGNRVVYKGTSSLAGKGDTIRVKATVEAHDDYKGENQTKIARPKLLGTLDPEDGKFYIWDSKISGMTEVK